MYTIYNSRVHTGFKPAKKESIGSIIGSTPEFDSEASVFFSWDLENDWKILDVSDNVSLFGYTVEECLDERFSYSDLVHPHDLDRVFSELQIYRELEGTSSFVQNYRILAKDGSVANVKVLNTLTITADGAVGSAYGFMIEMTSLSNIAHSNNASFYLESIIDSLKESILIIGNDFEVIYANDSFYELFKVGPEDVIGKNARKFAQFRQDSPELFSKLKDVCAEGKPVKNLEFTYTFSNVGMRTISLNVNRLSLSADDGCLLFVAFEDITELKKAEELLSSEEKYASLVEKGTEGIIVVRDDIIKYANTKFCELRGLQKEDIIGSDLFSHIPTEYHRMISIKIKKWMASKKKDPKSYEVNIFSKDEENIPVEITASHGDYGGEPGLIITINDIREKRKAKEALIDTEKNFRLIFEKSPMGIVRFDQKGTITNSNEVFDELFNHLHENVLGQSLFDFLKDDKIRQGLNDVLTGKSNNFESETQLKKDNNSLILRLNLSSLIVDGFPQGGMAIFDDVTLHKMGEESLQQNENRLKILLELSQMADDDVSSIIRFALRSALDLTQSSEGYIIRFGDNGIPDLCLSLLKDEEGQYDFNEESINCSSDLKRTIKENGSTGKPLFSNILTDHNNRSDISGKAVHRIELPFYDGSSIKFVLGVENKDTAYNYLDTHNLKLLLQSMWKLIIHREANEALEASEEKYSTLVERGNDGIIIIQDGMLKFANPMFCEIVGLSPDKVHDTKFTRYISPEYIRMVEKLLSKILEKKKSISRRSEIILMGKSRGSIPVEITTSRIDHNGKPSIMTIIHDITKPKEKERELLETLEVQKVLQAVIKSSPAVVFFWGSQSEWPVEFVSENIEKFGYSPEEFISGKLNYSDIIHPSDSERVHAYFDRKNYEGTSEYRIEYRIITKTGDVRWVEERSTPQYDEEGKLAHIQGIIIDITERKRIDQFLNIESEVGNLFTPSRDLQETFDQLLEFSLHIKGLDCGALYIVDKNNGDLNLVSNNGLSEEFVKTYSHYGPDSIQNRFFLTGYPLYKLYSEIFPLTRHDKRVDEGLLATAVIPVKYREEIVAVLFLASHDEYDISYDVHTSIETIAAQIGSIIGRIETEVDLQKNQNDLKLLLDSINDLIFVLDNEGCVLYTNESVTGKLGYSKEEITGMNFIKMHPHNKVLDVANYFSEAVSGKETVFTLPLLTNTGMAISVETRLNKGIWNKQEALVAACREVNRI
ncbi:PAS domain S-box protein [Methanococcoides orientis]|uniref:PAS domain S-box protein n=1 Tax=Methanococcoides orientis TaxID=2822137 RepID=UPI001E5B3658|nr:PAS domain S-box protein [Methanococcoides orientis]UGV41278.1 PAS domain S-box protein [Methanococcoides orientis]